jgi:hypothetical protein
MSLFNPQQEQTFSSLLKALQPLGQQGASYYSGLLSDSPEAFQKFSQPYRNQFQQNTVPQIAERFAGMGGLSSSGFQQSLGQAGAGLEDTLAQLFEGLKGGAAESSFSNLQNLLGQTTQTFLPKQLSFLKQLLLGLSGGGGQALGGLGGMGIGKLLG